VSCSVDCSLVGSPTVALDILCMVAVISNVVSGHCTPTLMWSLTQDLWSTQNIEELDIVKGSMKNSSLDGKVSVVVLESQNAYVCTLILILKYS
jgi:hypothetical protein